jgi:outer membrane protein TolC
VIWLATSALSALAGPLTLDEVLQSVDERVPQLLAARAELQQAEAALLAARGAFDPALQGSIRTYQGEDPRTISELSVTLPSALGPSVSAGWTRGMGEFPAYAGEDETSAAGEAWVGLELPLLDGLLAGTERTQLVTAGLAVELATLEQSARLIDLRRGASEAWARWSAAGAELVLDTQLLELAERRVAALESQVAQGARARLDLLDSQRVLAERRAELAQARLDLQAAALALSLWYRDSQGRPVVPPQDALSPLVLADPPAGEPDPGLTPLAQGLDLTVRLAEAELRRARNGLLPKVDLYAVASHDPLGYDELQAGAKLEVGSLWRAERGKLGQASAKLAQAEAKRQAALDELQADMAAARLAVQAAEERYRWAQQAQQAADEVLLLEQRRLELGGADLFQLLVRESAAASARRATVKAWTEHQLALARYQAVIAPVPGWDSVPSETAR